VGEAASGLFRSGQLFGSHLVTLLSLGLLLALLAGLNAMKPARLNCLTRSTHNIHRKKTVHATNTCAWSRSAAFEMHFKVL